MYNLIKKDICPRCGEKDLGEGAFCAHCLTSLLNNKVTETWTNWTTTRLGN